MKEMVKCAASGWADCVRWFESSAAVVDSETLLKAKLQQPLALMSPVLAQGASFPVVLLTRERSERKAGEEKEKKGSRLRKTKEYKVRRREETRRRGGRKSRGMR